YSEMNFCFDISSFKNLFPNKWSAIIFVSYMALFINQGLLVTATKTKDNRYTYSTIAAVFFTECTKLCIAISIYLKDEKWTKLMSEVLASKRVLILYFVPAFLYCVYNNLAFVNLQSYDPTTYYLLLQFRVVVTAVIYQILFNRKLSKWQWISLILLTFGCIVKNIGQMNSADVDKKSLVSFGLLLILFQVFCSCFAGVYNEYLLKDNEVHIMIQNIFMYIASMICNFFAFLSFNFSQLNDALSYNALQQLFQPIIIAVIVNNALCGIVTSLFLKDLNSILKTFASALEIVFTAVFCWILFKIPIDLYTVIAIAIVTYATFLYSQNPVVNRPKDIGYQKDEELNQVLINNSRKARVTEV
ncbi:UDP-galactose transporter-like protein, partial [Leptotrombidium deliense]